MQHFYNPLPTNDEYIRPPGDHRATQDECIHHIGRQGVKNFDLTPEVFLIKKIDCSNKIHTPSTEKISAIHRGGGGKMSTKFPRSL